MDFATLSDLVRSGPDADAASAAAEFAGDVNHEQAGFTLLTLAVENERLCTIAALAARGDCNPNVGSTEKPIHAAACKLNDASLRALLRAFPDVDVNVPRSATTTDTPLHAAAKYATDGERCSASPSVQLLLAAGADPTVRCRFGKTPAQTAREQYHSYTAIALLQAEWQARSRAAWTTACVALAVARATSASVVSPKRTRK